MPATALGATAGNRLFYGILFLMSILLYRNYFYAGRVTVAETHYATLVSIVAVGYGCAALVSPVVTRRLTKPAYIAVLLAASAVVSGALGVTFIEVAYLVMGFFLGLAGQGIAISATTVLQEQAADSYRGRMFAFYDMMFNISFVVGAAVTAQFMPVTGKSAGLIAGVAIGYAVVAAAYWMAARQSAGGGPDGSIPADAAQASSS